VRVFESGAILMYLAEKFGNAFLPAGGAARAECLSWLFWQMGSAPFLGGGFGHFYAYAPTKQEYPINRYAMEVKRQLDVLNRLLAERRYLAGDDYTVADIATWPWYGARWSRACCTARASSCRCRNPHVIRWADEIAQRPAVQRGRMVNRVQGDPASQLHERHEASDFDTKTQDKLARPAPEETWPHDDPLRLRHRAQPAPCAHPAGREGRPTTRCRWTCAMASSWARPSGASTRSAPCRRWSPRRGRC
jgi:GST-like protein